jgi:hypothetical protein
MQLISNDHCGSLALQYLGTIFKVKVLEERFIDLANFMPEKPGDFQGQADNVEK